MSEEKEREREGERERHENTRCSGGTWAVSATMAQTQHGGEGHTRI